MLGLVIIILSLVLLISYLLINAIYRKIKGGIKTTFISSNKQYRPEQFIDISTKEYEKIVNDLDENPESYEEIINGLTPPAQYPEYNNEFELFKQALISYSNHIAEVKHRLNLLSVFIMKIYVPIVEALVVYKDNFNQSIQHIEFLGAGAFNSAFKIISHTNEKLVLKIQDYSGSERAYHEFEYVMKISSHLRHFPKVYFGSWSVKHEPISSNYKFDWDDPNAKMDCSWNIMKLYVPLKENEIINNPVEVEKCYIAMIRLACDLYENRLVFNDWKIDNMLYDPETNDYVIGDTDFKLVKIVSPQCIYHTATVFSRLQDRYNSGYTKKNEDFYRTREEYENKVDSFNLMIYMIKESMVEVLSKREYNSLSVDEINQLVISIPLSGVLRAFVNLVHVPKNPEECIPFTVDDIKRIVP